MIPSGFSLVIFRPKFFCTYEKLIHELGKLDLVTLLHHEDGPKVGKPIKISFDPFVLRSSLNLNIPLQALAVVDMYKREEAQFTNIFKCEAATQQLSLRDVIHEAEIQLHEESFPFRHLTPEADEQAETEAICGKYLFFIMDDLKWVPLLFGERFAKACWFLQSNYLLIYVHKWLEVIIKSIIFITARHMKRVLRYQNWHVCGERGVKVVRLWQW